MQQIMSLEIDRLIAAQLMVQTLMTLYLWISSIDLLSQMVVRYL